MATTLLSPFPAEIEQMIFDELVLSVTDKKDAHDILRARAVSREFDQRLTDSFIKQRMLEDPHYTCRGWWIPKNLAYEHLLNVVEKAPSTSWLPDVIHQLAHYCACLASSDANARQRVTEGLCYLAVHDLCVHEFLNDMRLGKQVDFSSHEEQGLRIAACIFLDDAEIFRDVMADVMADYDLDEDTVFGQLLMIAALQGNFQIVATLFEAGATVAYGVEFNKRARLCSPGSVCDYTFGRDDTTVLAVAAKHANADVVRWLVDSMSLDDDGTPFCLFNYENVTFAADIAAYDGRASVMEVLIDHLSPEDRQFTSCLCLLQNAKWGDVQGCEQLLTAGASTQHESLRNPLHEAALMGHVEVVQLLLASIDRRSKLEYYLEHEKYPHLKDLLVNSCTYLQAAAIRGHAEVVDAVLNDRILKKHPKSLSDGLLSAVQAGRLEVVKTYLNNGFDLDYRPPDRKSRTVGELALRAALQSSKNDIVALLRNYTLRLD